MAIIAAPLIWLLALINHVEAAELSILPFPISGKCLVSIYTHKVNMETTIWLGAAVQEASIHNVPIMAFGGPQKTLERFQQNGYYKTCNIFLLYYSNGSIQTEKLPLVRSPQSITDFVILILNGTNVEASVRKSTSGVVSPAEVPENMLILAAEYNQEGLPCRFHALYVFTTYTACCEGSYKAISVDKMTLEISPGSSTFLRKTNFNSHHVIFAIWTNQYIQSDWWRFMSTATFRDMHMGKIRNLAVATDLKEVWDICVKFNFTPITIFRNRVKNLKHKYPVIVLDELDAELIMGDRGYYGEYSRRGSATQTFLYCTRKKNTATSLLTIFHPLDSLTWLVLLFVLVPLLIHLRFSYNLKPLTAAFAVLSPLVSQTTDTKRGKKLLLLWSFVATITGIFYTGAIGSLLVVPPAEKLLKTFKDLVENGYWVQIRGNDSSTYNMVAKQNRATGSFRYNKHFSALLQQHTIAPRNRRLYLTHLASTSHSTAVNSDGTIEAYLSFLHKYHENAECHKGEEVLYVAGYYAAFLPPYSVLLRRAFDRLFESGITKKFQSLRDLKKLEFQREVLSKAYKGQKAVVRGKLLDFSFENPQGPIPFYWALIGFALSLGVFFLADLVCGRLRYLIELGTLRSLNRLGICWRSICELVKKASSGTNDKYK